MIHGKTWVRVLGLALAYTFAASVRLDAQATWPQWRGPLRDGVSTERGLLPSWPAGGPKLLWQVNGLGAGYSSVSIANGRIYTMGDIADPTGGKSQYVIALDLASRKKVWTAKVGRPHSDGPRCTPTVDRGLVFAEGTDGDVVCVREANGAEVWRRNIQSDLGGAMMSGWRFSESPLVDGERVVVTPGMPNSTLAALDRRTGKVLWRCAAGSIGSAGADGAGYSSPVVATVGKTRMYVQSYGRGVIGVESATGKLLWSYNRVACGTANIMTPIVRPPYVFVSNAYGAGSVCLKLTPTQEGVSATEVYFLDARTLQNHHGGMVLVGSHVYGGHGQNAGAPICVELATGKVVWKADAPGRGSAAVMSVDGRLIFRYDSGLVALIDAKPSGYRLISSFQEPPANGPAWAHPVVLDGKLYLRHDDLLLCYNLKGR